MSLEDLAERLRKSLTIDRENSDARKPNESANIKLTDAVFGRICTTSDDLHQPEKLSLFPGRKTAFVFGPETVTGTLLSRKPYDMLVQLGYLPEYIHLKVCVDHRSFWLVVFRPRNIKVVPATWDGVLEFVKAYYPKAEKSLMKHLPEVRKHSVEFYEKHAGMKFIEGIKDPPDEKFMSYEKYISLKEPKAWQTRLFLYCELKLFELFQGDGFTKFESGARGEKEYICPNLELDTLGKDDVIILPMNIVVPEEVKRKFDKK